MYASQYLTYDPFTLGRDVEHTIVADTIEYAEDSFVDAKERLLDVRNWKRYCTQSGISFVLRDNHGKEVNRKAHKGDHVNIQMPGADMQCCVIEALEYDDYPDLRMETFTMRIQPCSHSHNEDEEENNAEGALIVERRGKQVFATFYTKNLSAGNGQAANPFGLSDAAWSNMIMKFID